MPSEQTAGVTCLRMIPASLSLASIDKNKKNCVCSSFDGKPRGATSLYPATLRKLYEKSTSTQQSPGH